MLQPVDLLIDPRAFKSYGYQPLEVLVALSTHHLVVNMVIVLQCVTFRDGEVAPHAGNGLHLR